jgi:hypothetical protein
MKIAQETVREMIRQMGEIDAKLRHGKGIAIKDIQGKVVSLDVSASGERENWGINDNFGTYYYFRLNGTASEVKSTPAQRYGSCGLQIQQRVPLKLVAQHRCQSPIEFLESVKAALYATHVNLPNLGTVTILPINSNAVPWEVYASETGRDASTLHSLLQIVSIDFTLQIEYAPADKCFFNPIC